MGDEKYTEAFERFQKSNSTHDFARLLLVDDEAQLKKCVWVYIDGTEVDFNCEDSTTFKAFLKMLKMKKASQ